MFTIFQKSTIRRLKTHIHSKLNSSMIQNTLKIDITVKKNRHGDKSAYVVEVQEQFFFNIKQTGFKNLN